MARVGIPLSITSTINHLNHDVGVGNNLCNLLREALDNCEPGGMQIRTGHAKRGFEGSRAHGLRTDC